MTEQALINLRRKRLAKRLVKKEPLFAFETLKADFPDYTLEQFQMDITKKKSRSKRKKKNPLVRYGRYEAMSRLLLEFEQTGDIEKALQAQRLRDRMHQDYRIVSWFDGKKEEFYCSAIMSRNVVQKITRIADESSSLETFIHKVHEFTKFTPGNFYHAKKTEKP